MDKDGGKPKTFVSTFRLDLKPQAQTLCVEKQKENGLDARNRTFMGNNKLGASSATGIRRTEVQRLEAPRFKEPLKDCTVCEGSDVTFQGVITGSRPVSVSWLHNGEKVHSKHTSFKNGVATLTLTQCSLGNAGKYTCKAENTAGQQSSIAVLRITATKEIPRANNHDRHCEVKINKVSHENCELPSSSKAGSQQRKEHDEVSTDIRDLHIHTKDSTSKGPPVEFLNPPEQVEVRVGEQARIRCDFRSSSVPVACCWIFNKDKAVVGKPRTSVRSTETRSSVEIS